MKKEPFRIVEVNKELIDKINSSPENMHQHNFEELIILTEGKADHIIDFDREVITAPIFVYVSKGKAHQFLPADDARGWIVLYENELVPDTRFHFYSNFTDRVNYSLENMECMSPLHNLCNMMAYEYNKPVPQFNIIRHLLAALLAKLEADSNNEPQAFSDSSNNQRIAFHNFLKILEENYKRPVGVQFYADKLNTSVRNLNLICQNVFHKSVSEIVETRKLIEAKQLLMNSGLTVSEIGFELGYNEKSYFTRVFSKKEGITPTEFRNQMNNVILK